MITVNRIEDQITGTVNGVPYSVTFHEENYHLMKDIAAEAGTVATQEEMKALVEKFTPYTKETYKDQVETASPFIYVSPKTGKYYLKLGTKVSSTPLPQVFVDKLLTSVEKGIDITPLVKCWGRYLRPAKGRPEYSEERAEAFANYISALYIDENVVENLVNNEGFSREIAEKKATTTQVAITQEGLLVCYKVSKEITTKFVAEDDQSGVKVVARYNMNVDPDTGLITYDTPDYAEDRLFEPAIMGTSGDAFSCIGNGHNSEGHFIRVGCRHELDSWDKVGPPMGPGLHCGGLNYIKNYQVEGTVTHNIFVDPSDIHTVNATNNQDGAMTVRRYFVHSSFAGPNKGIYHSSEYAKLGDAEFASLLSEVIDASQSSIEELSALA